MDLQVSSSYAAGPQFDDEYAGQLGAEVNYASNACMHRQSASCAGAVCQGPMGMHALTRVSLCIQALTFNKVAPMALGRIDMRYRRVECKPPSDMTVIVDQNRGSGGWIRLQVKVRLHLFRMLLMQI